MLDLIGMFLIWKAFINVWMRSSSKMRKRLFFSDKKYCVFFGFFWWFEWFWSWLLMWCDLCFLVLIMCRLLSLRIFFFLVFVYILYSVLIALNILRSARMVLFLDGFFLYVKDKCFLVLRVLRDWLFYIEYVVLMVLLSIFVVFVESSYGYKFFLTVYLFSFDLVRFFFFLKVILLFLGMMMCCMSDLWMWRCVMNLVLLFKRIFVLWLVMLVAMVIVFLRFDWVIILDFCLMFFGLVLSNLYGMLFLLRSFVICFECLIEVVLMSMGCFFLCMREIFLRTAFYLSVFERKTTSVEFFCEIGWFVGMIVILSL